MSFSINADDELDRLFGTATRESVAKAVETVEASRETFVETCPKCQGRGRFVSWGGRDMGPCFACKGAGKREFRTSPVARAQGRAAEAASKETRAADALAAFGEDHPGELAWMTERAPRFEFAQAMVDAVIKYGSLTPKQLAATRGLMEKDAARAGELEAAKPAAIETGKLMAAFEAAYANGLKNPILRFEDFTASMAKPTGRNPGAVYIKAGGGRGDYLGKIVGGTYSPSREAGARAQDIAAKVAAAMVDPVGAALAYGRSTGSCSCCGRRLTDPKSVAAGIGPDCASNFGF